MTPATFAAIKADYDRAKARLALHCAEIAPDCEETHETILSELSDQHVAALDRLLLTPGPDLRALRDKIDVIVAEEIGPDWHTGAGIFAILAADARKLFQQAALAEVRASRG